MGKYSGIFLSMIQTHQVYGMSGIEVLNVGTKTFSVNN
jgi:hypothetical protein